MQLTERNKTILIWIYEFVRYLLLLAATSMIAFGAIDRNIDLTAFGVLLLVTYSVLSIWTNKRRMDAEKANESGTKTD